MKRWLLTASCLLSSLSLAQPQTNLAELVQKGDRVPAIEAIRSGADVNLPTADGTTALHWAVYNVDAELVKQLLARKAKPDVVNLFGATPLAEAVKSANLDITKKLLDAGANVNLKNQDGQTPLMLATETGVLPLVKLLVDAKADVNAVEQWKGQTALMWAVAGNAPDVAELLIKKGADVNVRATAFDWGSQITTEPRSQYRPTGGLTPLLYSARSGCMRCLDMILAKGADINLPDPDGVNALMIAIDNNHYDAAAFLLEHGANPHSFDWWGRTPLFIAVDVNSYGGGPRDANKRSATDIMRLLLQAGVNPNPQLNMHRPNRGANNGRFADDLLNSGATPLLRAATTQDFEAIKVLLEFHALPDVSNAMGVTPLMAATGFGSPRLQLTNAIRFGPEAQSNAIKCADLLLAAGANINSRVADTTSLTTRVARLSSMTDRTGQNALFGAVYQGWITVAGYLFDHGIDATVKDARGKTIVDSAMGTAGGRVDVNRPNQAMLDFLRSKGVDIPKPAAPAQPVAAQ